MAPTAIASQARQRSMGAGLRLGSLCPGPDDLMP